MIPWKLDQLETDRNNNWIAEGLIDPTGQKVLFGGAREWEGSLRFASKFHADLVLEAVNNHEPMLALLREIQELGEDEIPQGLAERINSFLESKKGGPS